MARTPAFDEAQHPREHSGRFAAKPQAAADPAAQAALAGQAAGHAEMWADRERVARLTASTDVGVPVDVPGVTDQGVDVRQHPDRAVNPFIAGDVMPPEGHVSWPADYLQPLIGRNVSLESPDGTPMWAVNSEWIDAGTVVGARPASGGETVLELDSGDQVYEIPLDSVGCIRLWR